MGKAWLLALAAALVCCTSVSLAEDAAAPQDSPIGKQVANFSGQALDRLLSTQAANINWPTIPLQEQPYQGSPLSRQAGLWHQMPTDCLLHRLRPPWSLDMCLV